MTVTAQVQCIVWGPWCFVIFLVRWRLNCHFWFLFQVSEFTLCLSFVSFPPPLGQFHWRVDGLACRWPPRRSRGRSESRTRRDASTRMKRGASDSWGSWIGSRLICFVWFFPSRWSGGKVSFVLHQLVRWVHWIRWLATRRRLPSNCIHERVIPFLPDYVRKDSSSGIDEPVANLSLKRERGESSWLIFKSTSDRLNK